MDNLLAKIKDIANEIVTKYNFVCLSVERTKDYGEEVIKVTVEDVNNLNIDIDDVANVAKELIDIVSDLLPDDVYLEVSSVGLERELNSDLLLHQAISKYVFVSLYEKHPDIMLKEMNGYLTSVDDDEIKLNVTIKTKQKEITIERKKIAKIRLAVKF